MAEFFSKRTAQMLDERYALDEWTTISLASFCKNQLAERSIEATFGPRIFELNPELVSAFWGFDKHIIVLALGLPTWMMPAAHKAQERYYGMMRKYLDAAWGDFDYKAADVGDWNPKYGARICCEIIRWLKGRGFEDQVAVGAMAMLVFA